MVKGVPKAFPFVLRPELQQCWPGLQGRVWSSPNQLGKSPTIAQALLLHRRLPGTGVVDHTLPCADEPVHGLALTPRLPAAPLKALWSPHSWRGCTAEGARLEREQTCSEMLQCRVVGSALAQLLSEVPLCCAPGAAGTHLSHPLARWNLPCSISAAAKRKHWRSIPWQEACPCFKLLWGKERKCF